MLFAYDHGFVLPAHHEVFLACHSAQCLRFADGAFQTHPEDALSQKLKISFISFVI